MKLKSEYYRQIRDALMGAFNPARLQSMARMELELDLDDIAGQNATKPETVEALIRWAEEKECVEYLLNGARKANPTSTKLERAKVDLLNAGEDAYVVPTVEDAEGGEEAYSDERDGDRITTGDLRDVVGVAIGRGARSEVRINEGYRDDFEAALHWDGKSRMREYDLSGKNLSGFDFSGADLTGSNLRRTDLHGADLRGAILNGVDLSHANLFDAKLSRAKLLERPILFHAELNEAILKNVEIFAGNLHGAKFRSADLSGAKVNGDVSKADLSEAKLQGADLRHARGLWDVMSLVGATYDKKTKWPEGFDPKAAGAILVDDEGNPVEESEG